MIQGSSEQNQRYLRPSSDQYRQVIGHFASGVTVITTAVGDERFGTTANAVTSLSVDPPMMLVCLNQESTTGRAVDRSGYFVVNILTEKQEHLANHFATKNPEKSDAAGVEFHDHIAGRPLIRDSLAHLECAVTERVTSATHVIFIGLVEVAILGSGSPLAYYRGAFHRLAMVAAEDVPSSS
jgi:flavin reductase (DIM6/NTAB) family NADH-FMN oxidoreductase RutF